MNIPAKDPDDYMAQLPEDRRDAMDKLRKVIRKNLPKGYKEGLSYGMIGYFVPHTIYPGGYHCYPKLPLPFINLASQKNFIALYHMGIYAMPELHDWFVAEYAARVKGKLDMGKSCVRFKKPDQIPFDLIGELVSKVTPADWIVQYERAFRK